MCLQWCNCPLSFVLSLLLLDSIKERFSLRLKINYSKLTMKYIFPCFLQGQQDKTREKFWKREGWSWYESRTEKGKRQLRKQKRKTRSSENRKILRSVCCGIKGKDFTLNKVLTPKRLLWNFRLNWRSRQPCSNWNSISRFKNEDLSSLESQVVVLTIIDVRLNWKKKSSK